MNSRPHRELVSTRSSTVEPRSNLAHRPASGSADGLLWFLLTLLLVAPVAQGCGAGALQPDHPGNADSAVSSDAPKAGDLPAGDLPAGDLADGQPASGDLVGAGGEAAPQDALADTTATDAPAISTDGGADRTATLDGLSRDQGTVDSGTQDGGATDAGAADITADRPDGTAVPDALPIDRGVDGVADGSGSGGDGAAPDSGTATPFRVLLFSGTAAFRHASIPNALTALRELQAMGGYVAEATEDPTAFNPANLARFEVVVWVMTSGDILNATQQTAFENWIAAGGGYVGIHSASDTEYTWPFYGTLVGAYFDAHPAIQMATVRVEAPTHPVMAGIPTTWPRRDEWYNFRTNPRANVTVLATLDESTYTGGTMGADHPIVWVHTTAGGGRAFYTALGHTPESYVETPFRRHLVNGLRWVAKR